MNDDELWEAAKQTVQDSKRYMKSVWVHGNFKTGVKSNYSGFEIVQGRKRILKTSSQRIAAEKLYEEWKSELSNSD